MAPESSAGRAQLPRTLTRKVRVKLQSIQRMLCLPLRPVLVVRQVQPRKRWGNGMSPLWRPKPFVPHPFGVSIPEHTVLSVAVAT